MHGLMGAYWTITLFTLDRHSQNDDKKAQFMKLIYAFAHVCRSGYAYMLYVKQVGEKEEKISVCLSMYLNSEGNILGYCIVSAIMNSQNDIHEGKRSHRI